MRSHAPVKVRRVQEFLHAHWADNPSLDALAQLAGLSRFHLCRVFRQTIGITPSAYQLQVRINQAKRLIIHRLGPVPLVNYLSICRM